jgi:hypothetical protein
MMIWTNCKADMDFLNTLKIAAALATVVTGVFSMIKPLSVQSFTGLHLPGPRGITEIRAVLGGFFIALGAAPLVFQSREMVLMLGIAYLGVAMVRALSIFIDKSFVNSNYISLAIEILLGIILVI